MLLASGMCASIVMMLALVPAGGHIVTTTDCYRKTRMFIENFLPKMGIKVEHTPAHLYVYSALLSRGRMFQIFFPESILIFCCLLLIILYLLIWRFIWLGDTSTSEVEIMLNLMTIPETHIINLTEMKCSLMLNFLFPSGFQVL